MNRFYVMVGVLAVVLGIGVFALLKTGGASAPAAAAGAPPTVVDDSFRGYTLGRENAPVEIAEYLDFECPVCATFATIQMPTITEQLINTGKARWRFRDYPLPIHKYSRFAAHAAQCAGAQAATSRCRINCSAITSGHKRGTIPRACFATWRRPGSRSQGVRRLHGCRPVRGAHRVQPARGRSTRGGRHTDVFANGKKLFNGLRRLPNSDDFKTLVDSIIAHSPRH